MAVPILVGVSFLRQFIQEVKNIHTALAHYVRGNYFTCSYSEDDTPAVKSNDASAGTARAAGKFADKPPSLK